MATSRHRGSAEGARLLAPVQDAQGPGAGREGRTSGAGGGEGPEQAHLDGRRSSRPGLVLYLALDGVYHPLRTAFPNNPTLE